MTAEQKQAYEWAKNQNYQSVAARYAKELCRVIAALQSENGSKDKEIERLKKTVSALVSDRARAWAERDAAVEDIRFAVVRDDWCVLCAHYCIDGKPAYRPGEGYLEFCMDCGNGCRHFEWRGAQGGVNMGVTIECKKTGRSIDLGCGGFNNLRNKVAELVGNPFAEHYLLLSEPSVMFMMGEARKAYFEKYDQETEKLVTEKKVHIKIADFLYQCDCGGKIRYGACKEILKVIGDYDDNILYGYCGRADCAKFSDFKAILKDCVANKSDMVWS